MQCELAARLRLKMHLCAESCCLQQHSCCLPSSHPSISSIFKPFQLSLLPEWEACEVSEGDKRSSQQAIRFPSALPPELWWAPLLSQKQDIYINYGGPKKIGLTFSNSDWRPSKGQGEIKFIMKKSDFLPLFTGSALMPLGQHSTTLSMILVNITVSNTFPWQTAGTCDLWIGATTHTVPVVTLP